MTSLRARIALLLIASIVGVVAIASFVATSTMQPPSHDAIARPIARQLATILRLNNQAAGTPDIDLRSDPAPGERDARGTAVLATALRHLGMENEIVVTRIGQIMMASIHLKSGKWFVTEIPNFAPPDDRTRVFLTWMSLVLLGAIAVALYFAAVLTRPLTVLQKAVSQVGTDGTLPTIAENGTGEVRATAKVLNQLSSRLKTAMESRMRLIAAAGHDLRTPITRMRLRAEFLDEPQRSKWLSDMDELERIAESAITLVKEETAGGDIGDCRLDDIIRDIVGELTLVGHRIEIEQLHPCQVFADALSLRRALRNLLTNAATHGISATVDLDSDDMIAAITITDCGPGIREDLLDKAFEPFFRADPARRQSVPGAGLGMAIAKEIIERNGGEISISNNPSGGLLQIVTFPCKPLTKSAAT